MESNKKPKTLLIGSINYVEWHRQFVSDAKQQDVWDLFSGKFEPLVYAPQPDFKEYQLRTRSGLARAFNPGRDVVNDRNVSENTVQTRTIAAVACFNYDCKVYETGQEKIKTARALIAASVSPLAATAIRSMNNPVVAYKTLKKNYEPPAAVAAERLSFQLRNISLGQFGYNIEAYLATIFGICSDLAEYGQELNDGAIAKHILSGLPDSYKDFQARHGWMSKSDVVREALEMLYADLLAEAARREYENRSLMD